MKDDNENKKKVCDCKTKPQGRIQWTDCHFSCSTHRRFFFSFSLLNKTSKKHRVVVIRNKLFHKRTQSAKQYSTCINKCPQSLTNTRGNGTDGASGEKLSPTHRHPRITKSKERRRTEHNTSTTSDTNHQHCKDTWRKIVLFGLTKCCCYVPLVIAFQSIENNNYL